MYSKFIFWRDRFSIYRELKFKARKKVPPQLNKFKQKLKARKVIRELGTIYLSNSRSDAAEVSHPKMRVKLSKVQNR